ncbi:CCA-adding enzyme [uncultured Eubacterium sp.]|nr:CCA-adding enzyme [uncultured Eubacterium sp.]
MIKFDKDVLSTLKTLEKEGFETYAVGDCVRDLIRGVPAYDWDLVTKASMDDLQRFFPKGNIISGESPVMRIDFTYEVKGKDEDEPSHLEGSVLDIHHMEGTIEDEMGRSGFTVDAMADNPDRTFVDPYGGREDIKKKLVRAISDPDRLFKEEPIKMMEAVRLAAEMGFDLQKEVYDAIVANWRLLLDYDVNAIRVQLERILVSDNAGKGLNMMGGTGLMAAVLSEEVSNKLSKSDMRSFHTVCKNIDKTRPVRTRRLGLLYTAFSKKRSIAAIEYLNFDEKTKKKLITALNEMIDINFLVDELTFKRYLHKHGSEIYNYLHNLSKAQRIVYDQPANKIEARNYYMQVIKSSHAPVFAEDLVIDANDIMEAGITDSPEKAQELLELVVSVVHKDAKDNKREILLKAAKKFSKNKFAAKTRYVKWMK